MTSDRAWAEEAFELLLRRVGQTAGQVGDRFPLHADPADGRWTTTGRGSWAGGFWAGLLWLRARHTGRAEDRASASAVTARLAPWAGADTATRGLILWYGTALATGDPAADELRLRSAEAALASWDPALGVVPWGAAFGGARLRARADGVPGLVPLLACAGPAGEAAAAAHLRRHLDLCLPRAGASRPCPAWSWDAVRGWEADAEPAPGWSRGEAWLLLAVADAMTEAPSRHGPAHDRAGGVVRTADTVELLLDRCGFLTGPLVPPADTGRPDGPLDTSAAAITAVALLKLARSVEDPRAAVCEARAEAILRRLTSPTHLTRTDGPRPAGMLLDGCYDADRGTAVRHEVVWGTFFLALALSALLGGVDLTRV
ncbi:sugar ABC transporter permease [Streptomyces sp. NPDC101158]|uniref:sugar ABC transporter permease n=1 Tax=Streptomyces sp. NPDC101158 TaxID=3366117 RepID=UPI0037F4CF2B